jgi:DNA-binding NtrC family response regulator
MFLRVLLCLPARLARRVQQLLAQEPVRCVLDPRSPWSALARADFDLLILARQGLRGGAARLHTGLAAIQDRPEVVVLGQNEDPEDRAHLVAAGALAVLNTTVSDASLGETLHAILARCRESLRRQLSSSRGEPAARLADFVSDSPTMRRFLAVARKMVDSDASLLILGETGVGKERLARAIHAEGPRQSGPFVAVNCGALPEALLESELFGHEQGAFTGAARSHRGLFELAHGGTLFLDEVGETTPALQVKLLRALQERCIRPVGAERDLEVDVRVIAATNRDLQAELREGRFRADLYYRLAVVALTIPPLRERRGDLRALVGNHLEGLCTRWNRRPITVAEDAMRALETYDWPGNVRELANVLERAVLLADGTELQLRDLPPSIAQAGAGPDVDGRTTTDKELPFAAARERVMAAFERDYFADLLRACNGRVGVAAARAAISPRTLFARLKQLGLRKEDFRGAAVAQ